MAYLQTIAKMMADQNGPLGAAPPTPMGAIPPPQPTPQPGPTNVAAEQLHQQKAQQFVKAAIADFHHGGITRQHLAEALADQDAYDYATWKKTNVVHPSNAVSHGVAAEPPDATMPTAGVAKPPPPPILGAGSI